MLSSITTKLPHVVNVAIQTGCKWLQHVHNHPRKPWPACESDSVVSTRNMTDAMNLLRCVKEAARVLKPGGLFVFTDMMQSDTADKAKLAEVRPRVFSRFGLIVTPLKFRGREACLDLLCALRKWEKVLRRCFVVAGNR